MRSETRRATLAAFLSYAFDAMVVDVSTNAPSAVLSVSCSVLASVTTVQIKVRFQGSAFKEIYKLTHPEACLSFS